MIRVINLQEAGLPAFSTSAKAHAAKLEEVLVALESEGYQLLHILEIRIGRSTHHQGVFRIPVPPKAKSKDLK